MARIGGGIHRRCSSEVVENSDSNNNIRPCLEEFHVLAVDDSFVDRKVIERLLKISSCKVTVVESGKRALQFLGLDEEKGSSVGCNGMKVHLIITDYSMPGMTGYELLKKIKESSTFKEVPVVIMSSENILTRIDRCLEEGAKDYLVKPVKLADVKRLKEFMQGDFQAVKEKSNASLVLKELHDLPSPVSRPSPSSARDFNPIIISYPCTSTKCICISKRPRFRNRSSKYRTGLSLY